MTGGNSSKKEDLESVLSQKEKSWLERKKDWVKAAFKQEKNIVWYHLGAAGVATLLATSYSYMTSSDSDAAISTIATIIDVGSYWATFFGLMVTKRDWHNFRDEEGKVSKKKIGIKTAEYLSYIGVVEAGYAILRPLSQYLLQTEAGMDPGLASLTVQLSATALFSGAWPLITYKGSQIVDKVENNNEKYLKTGQ